MSKIIDDLNWRYATKKFDPSRKISDTDLEIITDSLQLAPSSYGLQPLKYLIIEDKDLRNQLKDQSFNQTQITDASHLIVICAFDEISELFIDEHLENTSKIRSISQDSIAGYGNFMKKEILTMDKSKVREWNSKQAYIALGQLLHTCACLRIDATPMEGFNSEEYDRILDLNNEGLHAVLVCPIGYRSEADSNQHLKKVRRSKNYLFEIR
jgi:nitroreductase